MCGYIKVGKISGKSKRIDSRCYHYDEYDPTVYNLKIPNGVELIDEGDIMDDPVPSYNNYDYSYNDEDTFWDALNLIKDKDWKNFR